MTDFFENEKGEMKIGNTSGNNQMLKVNSSINEVLKERERREQAEKESAEGQLEMSLDSTERIKVLSPGQLIFKRFINNKLAIVGTIILLFMFLFSFVFPLFYPYSQTQLFYKYDDSLIDYAQATVRSDYSTVFLDDSTDIHYSVKNYLTTTINSMEKSGSLEASLSDTEGNTYRLVKEKDNIYSLFLSDRELVASDLGSVEMGSVFLKDFTPKANVNIEEGFAEAAVAAATAKKDSFKFNGEEYTLTKDKKTYIISKPSTGLSYEGKVLGTEFELLVMAMDVYPGSFPFNGKTYTVSKDKDGLYVYEVLAENKLAYLTTYVFDAYESGTTVSSEFRLKAIDAFVNGSSFTVNGTEYTVNEKEDEILIYEKANSEEPVVAFSNMVIRRYNGEDTLEFDFKEKVRSVIEDMSSKGSKTATFEWQIAQVGDDGEYQYDESGNLIKDNREVTVTEKNGSYTLTVLQVVYLIDTFAPPSKEHIAGTDGDGMDVLSRMMYGGRVSLLVAFVVVILETVLGIIMGGIAGYFGGWVDNLIMRLVDIFYCIPTMPILIIMGAMFDALKLKPYVRITWLMVILGVLGWAGVARMVRGQILSLREQEFMVAAEAIGLKTRHRIFKHLIPNVMPQLIVTATSGLGDVIITESTLSYLGLGVKHPLASWGTMINSVSTAEAMKTYTYIWIPVGLLICLTVIAFNFVGDGLRDAFDPKMKR